jgi:Cu/Ag efflux pump CusA
MISRIIDFSARNRFIVLALVAGAAFYGWWSMNHVALDAIPDLSDTQVIVYSRWDRSPDIVEDQVTYPIVSAMLGAPKVKAVRGFSDFGPHPHPRVPFQRPAVASRGRQDRTRAGRHGTRLDLPICDRGQVG